MKILLTGLILVILLAGCGPSPAAIEKALAQTQAAIPTATNTPEPTATQEPTITPEPTATLKPLPKLQNLIPNLTDNALVSDYYVGVPIQLNVDINPFHGEKEYYCAGYMPLMKSTPTNIICLYRYDKGKLPFINKAAYADFTSEFDASQTVFPLPENIIFLADTTSLMVLFEYEDLLGCVGADRSPTDDLISQSQGMAYIISLVYQEITKAYRE